ncbi:MAG: HEPN domain-containing protein [Acidobacteria bacterium]|nr:HEPN domain-containing protein [Acidobacteriota bacterium]
MKTEARGIDPGRLAKLRGELERIRDALAGNPEVRQLVVFGSVAAGDVHEWSDLDLVVIADTATPFVERAAALARRLQPRIGTQFLVYTPQEIRELAGRPFVRVEILEKGKVMPLRPAADAERWMEFARQDVKTAELALDAGIFNQVCFHSQQAAEKCLKGCLAAGGELLARTHLIADLLDTLPPSAREAFSELVDGLLALDQFSIPTRYPDALPGVGGLPGHPHAEEALATARACLERATAWIARSGAAPS